MQYIKKSHIQVTLTSRKLDFLFMKLKWRNAPIWQSDPAVGVYSGGPSLMPAACSVFEMPPICSTRDPGTFLLSLGVSEPRGWICQATGLNPLVNTGISWGTVLQKPSAGLHLRAPPLAWLCCFQQIWNWINGKTYSCMSRISYLRAVW